MKDENIIEKLSAMYLYKYADVLDKSVLLVIKPKPWYLPRKLWLLLIKELFELKEFQSNNPHV